MKNKHLVLLFMLVVALGLIIRWLPDHYRTFSNIHLIKLDPKLTSRLVLSVPGQTNLVLEKIEGNWVADQNGRTTIVAKETVDIMLSNLVNIAEFEIVKTEQADTLGFVQTQQIGIRILQQNGDIEKLDIGKQNFVGKQAVTYLRLPNHAGIYQVPGHFRKYFLKTLNDFRQKTVAQFVPDSIQKIGIQWADTLPIYLAKPDSVDRWAFTTSTNTISADSVQNWLQQFRRLNACDFADYFDESRAAENLRTTIYLGIQSGAFFKFRFFYVKPPNVPEDLARARNSDYRSLPLYVLHSSQNPDNFFAIPDSNLVAFLCGGLVPAPSLNPINKLSDNK